MTSTHARLAISLTSVVVLALAAGATIGRDDPGWNRDAAGQYLDGRAKTWFEYAPANRGKAANRTSCVCCHTVVPYALSRPTLRKLTATSEPTEFEKKLLAQTNLRVANWANLDTPDFALLYSSGAEKESWGTEAVLNALILATDDRAAGRAAGGDSTKRAFANLWATQIADGPHQGSWDWLDFRFAPWENKSARYFGATLAAIATGAVSGNLKEPAEVPVTRLRDYLKREFAAQNLHHRAWALQAATAFDGILSAEEKKAVVSQLLAKQQTDGGWNLASLGAFTRVDGTTQDNASDGYATGLVLYTLQTAGVPRTDAHFVRGLAWLKANQQPGGEWRAASLNKNRDSATHVGKFMSDAATAMAVLALGGNVGAPDFPNAARRLINGDFSWADPLFEADPANGRPTCRIVEWFEHGYFDGEPQALAEALSAACFNGRTEVARYLLDRGVDPAAGDGTGLNAVHWAANRGQLETVQLLLKRGATLETRNMYGGTVLGCTVWSAVNEPHADHVRIIEALLAAGADVAEAEFPSGNAAVDEVLRRHGAAS